MTLKMLKRYWSLRQKLKSGHHMAAPADSPVAIMFIIRGLLIYKYFIVYILF